MKMTTEAVLKRATDGVAVGGLTLPAWVGHLQDVSAVAAALVPILSALWLAVQIARFVWAWWRGAGNGEQA